MIRKVITIIFERRRSFGNSKEFLSNLGRFIAQTYSILSLWNVSDYLSITWSQLSVFQYYKDYIYLHILHLRKGIYDHMSHFVSGTIENADCENSTKDILNICKKVKASRTCHELDKNVLAWLIWNLYPELSQLQNCLAFYPSFGFCRNNMVKMNQALWFSTIQYLFFGLIQRENGTLQSHLTFLFSISILSSEKVRQISQVFFRSQGCSRPFADVLQIELHKLNFNVFSSWTSVDKLW